VRALYFFHWNCRIDVHVSYLLCVFVRCRLAIENSFSWATNSIVGQILTSQIVKQMPRCTGKMAATTDRQLIEIDVDRRISRERCFPYWQHPRICWGGTCVPLPEHVNKPSGIFPNKTRGLNHRKYKFLSVDCGNHYHLPFASSYRTLQRMNIP
jgi:hypothetical protein